MFHTKAKEETDETLAVKRAYEVIVSNSGIQQLQQEKG
jgi:hypothetical protein